MRWWRGYNSQSRGAGGGGLSVRHIDWTPGVVSAVVSDGRGSGSWELSGELCPLGRERKHEFIWHLIRVDTATPLSGAASAAAPSSGGARWGGRAGAGLSAQQRRVI